MKSTVVPRDRTPDVFLKAHRVFGFLILLIWCSAGALAQNASQPTNSTATFSIRGTHLLGFEGASNNANGTLSFQGDALQFQKGDKPAVQVKIASVHDVFLGEQSKQVGGLPMTLGKAAAPYGGGRVVSSLHTRSTTLLPWNT